MGRVLILALTAPGRRWCTLAAALALALVICASERMTLPALCGELSGVSLNDWQAIVGPVSPFRIAAEWGLMLVVMMAPLFAEPLRHVWFSSLVTRRSRAVVLCTAGYFGLWMAVAPVVFALSWVLQVLFSTTWALPAGIGAAIAWSSSPWAQRARNRCHRLLRVGATGCRADVECFVQGLHSGAMCVAVCWPWMVIPMLVSGAVHVPTMVGISLWLTLDRILPARQPLWQWPPAISQMLWRRRLLM